MYRIKQKTTILRLLVISFILLMGCLWYLQIKTKAADGDLPLTDSIFYCPEFRQYLSENFDEDNNGILSQDEIESITEMNISDVDRVEGLRNFPCLTKLTASNTSINLSDSPKKYNINF